MQGAGEHGGLVAFDPGRDIDKQREARRMAFGKTIGAEAFELLEGPGRERLLIAARDHPRDQPVAELRDAAGMFEGRHALAQEIGLARGKAVGMVCLGHRRIPVLYSKITADFTL